MTPEEAPWYLFLQPLIIIFVLFYGVAIAMHPFFLRNRLRARPGLDQEPVVQSRPPVQRKPLELKPQSFSQQLDSPLFSKIPAEIRNEIFNLALTQDEDMSHPYPEDAYYYRPGYRARRRIHTALLRTCQRIYVETRAVPFLNYEHTVWGCAVERAPPGEHNQMHHLDWFPSTMYPSCGLDPELCLRNVRFFTQLYWLEDHMGLNQIDVNPSFRTRKISVVIRHTDNWNWETDQPLAFKSRWTQAFSCPNTCEEIEIEFETVERKRTQLDPLIAHQVILWEFKRKDGRKLKANLDSIKVSRWTGSRQINGRIWSENNSSSRLNYYVVSVAWRLETNAVGDASSADINETQVLERLRVLSATEATPS